MPLLKNLTERDLQPEWMDRPDLDTQHLHGALRGLERVNWWSGSAAILWPRLRTLAHQGRGQRLRVLDVATGAGDVPIRLWHRARRAGLDMEIDGCDRNAATLQYARKRAEAKRATVQFFPLDVLRDDPPRGYDVIMSSLFLHHLDEDQATSFLRRLAAATRRMLLINDLVRSRAGFLLAYLGTRVLSTSPVVHTDGPRSVEGAFTLEEARALAEQAGLEGASVAPRWPCRYLLTWSCSRS
jgi:SAM-dependent methyltransferase